MTATEYIQLYGDDGRPLCSRKTKTCSKCKHRYIAKGKEGSEYHLLYCPECGYPRGCRQPVKNDGDVCRYHSKDARKGAGHPNAKTLRHSKYINADLLPSFQQTIEDEERLDLTAEIGLLDMLIDDRLKALPAADHRRAWEDVAAALDNLEEGLAAKNPKSISAALQQLHDLVSRSRDAAHTREEIAELVMKRTRVTESDRRRLSELGEYITRGALLTLLRYMIEMTAENVKDLDGGKEALSTISAGFAQLLGRLRSAPPERPSIDA